MDVWRPGGWLACWMGARWKVLVTGTVHLARSTLREVGGLLIQDLCQSNYSNRVLVTDLIASALNAITILCALEASHEC